MICHLSIPSKNPAQAAEIIAKVMDGESMKYPVVRGSYIIVANDGSGTAIEIWPETTTQSPGTGDLITEKSPDFEKWDGLRDWDYQLKYDSVPAKAHPVHIAISTKLKAEEIIDLANSVGWRAVATDRVVFNLVELWVDNTLLVECIPAEELDNYRSFTQPDRARELFALMPEH